MIKFNEQSLREELAQLSSRSRIAFAASCAQRLYDTYKEFLARTNQSDGDKIARALDFVWAHVLEHSDKVATEQMLSEVMALIPDPNEDPRNGAHLTAYAEDFVSAVAYSLRCLLTQDPKRAAWAARRVYEALDYFVINQNNIDTNQSDAEYRIQSDPLVQAELKRQYDDIVELKSAGMAISADLIKSIRQKSLASQAIVNH